jgi:hypothetical protein
MAWRLLCLFLFLPPAPDVAIVDLKPDTLQAFEKYVQTAEARLDQQARSDKFLWSDSVKDARKKLEKGQVLAEPFVGEGDVGIADGLIHDWVGAVWIPNVTLDDVLKRVQDYDHAAPFYKPEVVDSKLLSHNGDDYKIFMRLLKSKAAVTAVLNTEHEAHYSRISDTRCYSRSKTTRVAEVQNAGARDEKERPAGHDHGFLWRLNSYWRFEQREGGVVVECEAISLSRSIPTGLGWLVNPIIRGLPRDSLANTLKCTRASMAK